MDNNSRSRGDVTGIVKSTTSIMGVSHRGTRRVLDEYEGRLWTVDRCANNASIYRLNVD